MWFRYKAYIFNSLFCNCVTGPVWLESQPYLSLSKTSNPILPQGLNCSQYPLNNCKLLWEKASAKCYVMYSKTQRGDCGHAINEQNNLRYSIVYGQCFVTQVISYHHSHYNNQSRSKKAKVYSSVVSSLSSNDNLPHFLSDTLVW